MTLETSHQAYHPLSPRHAAYSESAAACRCIVAVASTARASAAILCQSKSTCHMCSCLPQVDGCCHAVSAVEPAAIAEMSSFSKLIQAGTAWWALGELCNVFLPT